MDMQNVSNLVIPEGSVRTIHDKNSRLLWGKLSYDTQYKGDSSQQTYTGKNIINFATINYSAANGGSATRNGATYTVTATSNNTFSGIQFTQTNLQLKPDTTYTFSATVQSTTSSNGSVVFIIAAMSAAGSNIAGNYAKAGERTVATFTTPSSIPNNASIRLYPRALDAIAVFTDIMVEENSAATNYEPYTGSSPTQIVPAPNPSYPQDVKVVTGEQTVTIGDGVSSEDFSISLGSIELCKIGDYQDYIYKSGDDWYVHKVIGKISSYNGETITTEYISTTGSLTNGATVYYVFATATDTQITDATLVGQLSAVHEWLTRYGYNATVIGNLPIIIDRTNL